MRPASIGTFLSFLCALVFALAHVASAVPREADETMPDSLRNPPRAPTFTLAGTRGLPQTAAAEALGENRLVVGLSGPWSRSRRAFGGGADRTSGGFIGAGTFAYGVAPAFDVFLSLTGQGSPQPASGWGPGLGALGVGAQLTVPMPTGFPLGLAVQASLFAGLGGNPIGRDQVDPYDYFETRMGTFHRGALVQTLAWGPARNGFQVHCNEGLAFSTGTSGNLLLLDAGLQRNWGAAVLGLEAHSRTSARAMAFADDPLWVTPSAQWRTGWNANLTAGADFALSRGREASGMARAWEPWRLIGGIAFTLDNRWEAERDAKWAALKAVRRQERLARAGRDRKVADAAADASRAAAAALEAKAAAEGERLATEQRAWEFVRAEQEKLSREEAAAAAAPPHTYFEMRLLAGRTLTIDSVPFPAGRIEIPPGAKPFLNELARVLARYPRLRYELGGHADSIGDPAYNLVLSQARAMILKLYLSEQEPDLADRIAIVGYGAARPVARNATASGRRANRRPDVTVINKAALAEYVGPPRPMGAAMAMGRE